MLVAKRSLSRSPLCGLWRFHHKGMTVINSPAIGSPSPRWRPRQLGGAESQPSDHAWSFWGAAPPCRHPGPQTPVATSAYKSSYWSLGDSRVSGATSWAPGQRQTPCGLGPTLGLTLFFIPVLTNHDACVRTEAGADTGRASEAVGAGTPVARSMYRGPDTALKSGLLTQKRRPDTCFGKSRVQLARSCQTQHHSNPRRWAQPWWVPTERCPRGHRA